MEVSFPSVEAQLRIAQTARKEVGPKRQYVAEIRQGNLAPTVSKAQEDCPFRNSGAYKEGIIMVMVRYIFIWPSRTQSEQLTQYRWYREIHGPEYVRNWGPYMTRYDTYKSFDPPPEAVKRFGAWNNRITDQWFISLEHWKEAMQPWGGQTPSAVLTPRPNEQRAATTLIPGRPTENFSGTNLAPEEKTVLRWFILVRYPDGVSPDEGDKWFLEVHSKEVLQQPGLIRYFSHRTIEADHPIRPAGLGMPKPWHRLVEQWYEDFDGWRGAVLESGIKYTPPPWAQKKEFPFMQSAVDYVSTFIGETPDIDFLRDVRPRP